jgi:hypothetical protein
MPNIYQSSFNESAMFDAALLAAMAEWNAEIKSTLAQCADGSFHFF